MLYNLHTMEIMEKKKEGRSKSQYIPIVLVWFYIILYLFTDLDIYASSYSTYIIFMDTFLLVWSILYYVTDGRRWGFVAKKSLLTVISLNVLTEMSFLFDMPNYYGYYIIIICIYILSLAAGAYNSFKNKK